MIRQPPRSTLFPYTPLSRSFRTACLITSSAADAEEAAQEAFVKAWRALPRFRAGAPFRPWLLTIVANEARNRRRAEGQDRKSTRLNSSHANISYAVFCLKKK